MYIFNTTFHIEDEVVDKCLEYLKNKYIPQTISCKAFTSPKLLLVKTQHHEQGKSYSLQFEFQNLEDFEKWIVSDGELLQQEMVTRFGDKIVGFITILEHVEI